MSGLSKQTRESVGAGIRPRRSRVNGCSLDMRFVRVSSEDSAQSERPLPSLLVGLLLESPPQRGRLMLSHRSGLMTALSFAEA